MSSPLFSSDPTSKADAETDAAPARKRQSSTGSHTVDTVTYGSLDSSQQVLPKSAQHNISNNNLQTTLSFENFENASQQSSHYDTSNSETDGTGAELVLFNGNCVLRFPSLRRIALQLSLYLNIAITLSKLVAYLQTYSLSVLAALLDSVLDVVSQAVLNYTETHSSMQRSSAFYPAGASRLEPIGVLTCAALMVGC